MQIGAERMCMPAPSVDQFVHAVKQTVLANKRWVSVVNCKRKSRNAFKKLIIN
jgi:branched-subunit amino acid aminotransferase/4-amino-4-deoxychorismate lyase